MALTLVIGNKNYSSWSMRPWLALRANNIAFEEVFIPLYTGDADKKRILGFTRSGKVPALIDDDVTIWDSLAIIEYIAEMFPEAQSFLDAGQARTDGLRTAGMPVAYRISSPAAGERRCIERRCKLERVYGIRARPIGQTRRFDLHHPT